MGFTQGNLPIILIEFTRVFCIIHLFELIIEVLEFAFLLTPMLLLRFSINSPIILVHYTTKNDDNFFDRAWTCILIDTNASELCPLFISSPLIWEQLLLKRWHWWQWSFKWPRPSWAHFCQEDDNDFDRMWLRYNRAL